MVRTTGTEETLGKSGPDAPIEERTTGLAVPTADEVRTLVEGPRRPIRWMRWLAAFALIAAGAAIVTYVALDSPADEPTPAVESVFTEEWLAAQVAIGSTPAVESVFTEEWLAAQVAIGSS